jgi:hypothetical protein
MLEVPCWTSRALSVVVSERLQSPLLPFSLAFDGFLLVSLLAGNGNSQKEGAAHDGERRWSLQQLCAQVVIG